MSRDRLIAAIGIVLVAAVLMAALLTTAYLAADELADGETMAQLCQRTSPLIDPAARDNSP